MVSKALERGLACVLREALRAGRGRWRAPGRAWPTARSCVTQVGYHYRFVGAFQEAARVVRSGALGTVHHVRAEAYGPVVLRPKGGTWRSAKSEGGGALYDYACHAIDLVNFVVGAPASVSGVVRHGVFSRDVEDEVYCTLHYPERRQRPAVRELERRELSQDVAPRSRCGAPTAASPPTGRSARSTCARRMPRLPDTARGWTVRYTTDLTKEVWFYLRGEEYSAQIDYFVQSIKAGRTDGENSFRSALRGRPRGVDDPGRARRRRLQRCSAARQRGTAAARGWLARLFAMSRLDAHDIHASTRWTACSSATTSSSASTTCRRKRPARSRCASRTCRPSSTCSTRPSQEGIRTFMCTTHDRVARDLRPLSRQPRQVPRLSASIRACPTRTSTPTR